MTVYVQKIHSLAFIESKLKGYTKEKKNLRGIKTKHFPLQGASKNNSQALVIMIC